MLNIQVLGHGLIPRGQGIAPRKEPFAADLKTIQAILNAGGLKVNMVNPTTGKLVPLTAANLKKMWNAYGNKSVKQNTTKTPLTHPSIPEKPVAKEPTREVSGNDIHEAVNTAFAAAQSQKVTDTSKKDEGDKKPEPVAPVIEEKKDEKADGSKDDKPEAKPGGLKPVNNPNHK